MKIEGKLKQFDWTRNCKYVLMSFKLWLPFKMFIGNCLVNPVYSILDCLNNI